MPCTDFSVNVEVLRAGRSTVHATADMLFGASQELPLRLHAVYGALRSDPMPIVDRQFPSDVGKADDYPLTTVPADWPLAPFWHSVPIGHQFEWRSVIGEPPWSPSMGGGKARQAAWIRLQALSTHRGGNSGPADLSRNG